MTYNLKQCTIVNRYRLLTILSGGATVVYKGNEGLKEYINTTIENKGLKKVFIASKMGLNNQQQLTNILNKSHITFDDVQRIAEAIGCQVVIDIVPIETETDRE